MGGLLLRNGAIITGVPGNEQLEQVDLLIEGELISSIATAGTLPAGDYEPVDCSGMTLIPGLINAHVHISLEPVGNPVEVLAGETGTRRVLRTVGNLKKMLGSGVTYFRDLGAPDYLDLELRDCIRDGMLAGPEFLAAGRMITMTGGHGFNIGRECDGPDDARKAAREQIRAGADVIKLMATGGVMTPGNEPGAPQLTLEELRAAVEEAHKAGRKTAAHAQGKTGAMNAVLAGIDSIEHGVFLDDEILELMVRDEVYLVPTLAAPHFILENGAAGGVPELIVEKTKRIIEQHYKSFELARKAGVKIAMGTDSGTPFNRHDGSSVELKLMVQHGMSPYEAILAATAGSADLLGISARYGSLAVGKIADIVAIQGNPLEDISILEGTKLVFKKGVRINWTG